MTRAAYSPIVVAGFVRAIESALIALVGALIYFVYVVLYVGFSWPYVWAIAGITAGSVIVFQAATSTRSTPSAGRSNNWHD